MARATVSEKSFGYMLYTGIQANAGCDHETNVVKIVIVGVMAGCLS
jgi:hypothetical protein